MFSLDFKFYHNYNYIVYLQELYSKTKVQGQENPLYNLSAEECKDIDKIHKATKNLELEIKHFLKFYGDILFSQAFL